MVRRWLPSIATLSSMALLMTAPADAVELGNASLQSSSGQPLAATIQLLDADGLDASQIQVQLASTADFQRFSLERIAALEGLQIQLDLSGITPVLRLSSAVSINEPFISLVLDTRWPSGRVLTEYTLRLESPAFSSQAGSATSIAPVRSEQQPLTSEPEVSVPDTMSTADVQAPEVSSAVASSVTVSNTATGTSASSAASSSVISNASTITVSAGDTLWELAQRVRPDSSVSVQQTMLALQRLNPQAFIGGNINRVRRGEILQVPELGEIRQLANSEAVAEVSRQNQQLTAGNGVARQPGAPLPVGPTASGTQGELRVVTVDDDAEDQRPDAAAAGNQASQRSSQIEALEDRLSQGEEELARVDAQNDELNARLAMLQEQISSAQEIIRLRDLELARLQQTLAEEEGAAATVEPPLPPVITMAPDAPLWQRLLHTLTSNIWAMLGAAGALILLLVLLMSGRSRAAERAKAQASVREDENITLGNDPDELLFSGVAEALNQAEADDAQAEAQGLTEIQTDFAAEVVDAEAEDAFEKEEKRLYNNKIQEEFEESLKKSGEAVASELPAATDLSDPELDGDWDYDQGVIDIDPFNLETALDAEELSGAETGADLHWPGDTAPTETVEQASPAAADDFDDLAFLPAADEFTAESLAEQAEDDEDFDFLSGADEVATKLDLARAYVDMGDSEGAREILEEVLKEGSSDQRRDAQDLLGKL